MEVVTVTNDNFEQEVLACKMPVVLGFGSEKNEDCRVQEQIFEELSEELEGQVKFGAVDVDREAALALKYQIFSIPALVVMHYGLFQSRTAGLQDKNAIKEMLVHLETGRG